MNKIKLLIFREGGRGEKESKTKSKLRNFLRVRTAEPSVNVSTYEIRFKNNWKLESQFNFYSFWRPVTAVFPFPIPPRKHMSEVQVLW